MTTTKKKKRKENITNGETNTPICSQSHSHTQHIHTHTQGNMYFEILIINKVKTVYKKKNVFSF